MKNLLSATALSLTLMMAGQVMTGQAFAADPRPPAEVKQDMRKLWEDHIVFTRNYIISDIAGLKDKTDVLKRLMKNQDEIGDAIKPYYGDDAGDKLSVLLKEHISQAGTVVADARTKSKNLKVDQKKWETNADEIAKFLAAANPNWKEEDLKEMLHHHLFKTTEEAVARLDKDWKGDIAAYDDNHTHMLEFSDMLTDGIARQFPERFAMR